VRDRNGLYARSAFSCFSFQKAYPKVHTVSWQSLACGYLCYACGLLPKECERICGQPRYSRTYSTLRGRCAPSVAKKYDTVYRFGYGRVYDTYTDGFLNFQLKTKDKIYTMSLITYR
jgi:hypothetical protein